MVQRVNSSCVGCSFLEVSRCYQQQVHGGSEQLLVDRETFICLKGRSFKDASSGETYLFWFPFQCLCPFGLFERLKAPFIDLNIA